MIEAQSFLEECNALAALLQPLEDKDFERKTQFKDWTINDVLGHLHIFNHAAELTLASPDRFGPFLSGITDLVAQGKTLVQAQYDWIDTLSGRALLEAWQAGSLRLAEVYQTADPKTRVKWAGPDMSARSSITARQMETWAHGQELFDLLGVTRTDTDRLRNIAHLAVVTIPFAFAIRKEPAPNPLPYVRLTAPSGDVWEWNTPQQDNRIEGSATAFCQTATQVRNVKDTDLTAHGAHAKRWTQIAQCFAGAPHDPPQPNTRFTQEIDEKA
ncbi:TIGR03084 family metal-binding protein [Sedimentitalea nanhaiensis]|uniref:TIGR03084 family protein n=1 Tax=Sedimentitalea nanhaiensis TaxID=999627 RepID=A0A1I7DFP7_9RHOB|nr:TIGR03084 family metal-binding protein [Sedimentitalea nanhaiensis]SFU10488.1 TIGR03084 family protein [Sedimentitalea nanhaiensis]